MTTIDTSGIDPTLPQDSDLQTSDLRGNLSAIKTQLDNAATDIDGIISGSTSLSNIDINSGNIDGVTLGASSPVTLTSKGIDDNATSTQITISDTQVNSGSVVISTATTSTAQSFLAKSNADATNWARIDLQNQNQATNAIIYYDQSATFVFRNDTNSAVTNIINKNSSGTLKTTAIFGGPTPDVRLYYDGNEVFSTVSGTIKFGTHTAIGAETVTGYITIKDSGGTSRKIAVVS